MAAQLSRRGIDPPTSTAKITAAVLTGIPIRTGELTRGSTAVAHSADLRTATASHTRSTTRTRTMIARTMTARSMIARTTTERTMIAMIDTTVLIGTGRLESTEMVIEPPHVTATGDNVVIA